MSSHKSFHHAPFMTSMLSPMLSSCLLSMFLTVPCCSLSMFTLNAPPSPTRFLSSLYTYKDIVSNSLGDNNATKHACFRANKMDGG